MEGTIPFFITVRKKYYQVLVSLVAVLQKNFANNLNASNSERTTPNDEFFFCTFLICHTYGALSNHQNYNNICNCN
jgi:hypothetical protein